MKKLLLLLLLSLSFTGSADTVTYRVSYSGDNLYGSDGSSCRVNNYGYGVTIVCDNDITYRVSYSGDNLYGSDGSSCRVNNYGYGVTIFCDNYNNTTYGYTSVPGDLAYEAGYGLVSALGELAGFQVQDEEGSAINDIANAIAEGIANEKSSNTRSYSSGSNNQTPSNSYRSANGILKCRAGYYKTDNTCRKLPAYAAAYSSGDGFYCKSGYHRAGNYCKENIPEYAYASGSSWTCITGYLKVGNTCQKEYIQKKEDKPKVADKTTSSTLKSESITTKKQTTLGFSGLSDLLGFLLLLTFLGLVFWRIFKPLKRLYKWLTRRRK